MKKHLFFIIAILTVSFSIKAQSPKNTKVNMGFDRNVIVLDSLGSKYTYENWNKLYLTGSYGLAPVESDNDSTAFVLYKRNPEEESKKFAALPKPEEAPFFKAGTTFKFTDLVDSKGQFIKKEELEGKVVVLNFWFIACPPCRYEMPELNRLKASFKDNKDIIFIAIALDKAPEVESFLKISPFDYRMIENARYLFYKYGVSQCPASLVIDKAGIIKFSSVGYNKGNVPYWLEKTISELK
jgi:thiol-disulfide isomerase/thioredoxin